MPSTSDSIASTTRRGCRHTTVRYATSAGKLRPKASLDPCRQGRLGLSCRICRQHAGTGLRRPVPGSRALRSPDDGEVPLLYAPSQGLEADCGRSACISQAERPPFCLPDPLGPGYGVVPGVPAGRLAYADSCAFAPAVLRHRPIRPTKAVSKNSWSSSSAPQAAARVRRSSPGASHSPGAVVRARAPGPHAKVDPDVASDLRVLGSGCGGDWCGHPSTIP